MTYHNSHMTEPIAALRIEVLEAFKALKASLGPLETALMADQDLPAWFLAPETLPLDPYWQIRRQVYALLQQFEYLDGQNPKEILVGAGLIAASQTTLTAIQQFNQCKDRFKQAMLALKKTHIKMNDDTLTEQFEPLLGPNALLHPGIDKDKRPETIAKTLKRSGLMRLHLKQCYRTIPILLERPVKVSWTWANTKAITRITQEQARKLLLKQGRDASIENQLLKLHYLSPEEPLAIVQELAPHLRANVVFKNTVDRMMVKGPIPLFYLAEEHETLPHIRPPGLKKKKDKERRIRSDVKLDPDPYLPAIRVHRYTLGQ